MNTAQPLFSHMQRAGFPLTRLISYYNYPILVKQAHSTAEPVNKDTPIGESKSEAGLLVQKDLTFRLHDLQVTQSCIQLRSKHVHFLLIVCLRLYMLVNKFSIILGRLSGFNQY